MTPSGMIAIRYTGDSRRSEAPITGKGKEWWPGELRCVPLARGSQLLAAGLGWERDEDEDDLVAVTAAQTSAGAVGVAGVTAAGEMVGPDGSPVSGAGKVHPTRMRAMVFSNSLSDGAYQDKAVTTGSIYSFGAGAIRNLNAMLGGPFVFDLTGEAETILDSGRPLVQGFFCWGGKTSTGLMPYLETCLSRVQPQIVFGRMFENDVGGIPLADSITSLRAFIASCKAVGAMPVVMTCVPRPYMTTTAHRMAFDRLYDACFDICAQQGAICLDSSTQYIDHSSAYPIPLSGYADTGAFGGHPNPRGNLILAKSWMAQLSSVLKPAYRDVPGKISGNAILDIIANPTMIGTAGSPAGVSNGWTLSGIPAGGAVTYGQVASGSRLVPKYSASYSGAAAGSAAQIFAIRCPNATTGFAVNDRIYFEVETEFVGAAPVGIKQIYPYIDFGSGNILSCNLMDNAVAGWAGEYPTGRCVWRSPIYTVPAGATSARFWMYVYLENGATVASCDLVVHSAVVRKYPGTLA